MGGLQAFQLYIKQRMEKALQEENLQTITLPVSEVHWYEKGREILVEGKMFDIESYSIEGEIFTATGVFDEHETRVVEMLGHFGDDEQNNFIIKLLLLTQSFIAFTIFSFFISFWKHLSVINILFSPSYSSPFLMKQFPPPKTSLVSSF